MEVSFLFLFDSGKKRFSFKTVTTELRFWPIENAGSAENESLMMSYRMRHCPYRVTDSREPTYPRARTHLRVLNFFSILRLEVDFCPSTEYTKLMFTSLPMSDMTIKNTFK